MAAQIGTVALRTLASPLVIRSSPHAIAAHGSSALITAMIRNGTTRLRQSGPNSGRRIALRITTSIAVPVRERIRTRTMGLMS